MTESAVYVVEKMAHGYKRQGRASGGGFYDHSNDPAQLWSGLKTFERRNRQLEPADIRDRLLHAATAAALAVPGGSDGTGVTAALGATVPIDRDQALARIRDQGRDAFLARARDLAGRFGPRFESAPALADPAR